MRLRLFRSCLSFIKKCSIFNFRTRALISFFLYSSLFNMFFLLLSTCFRSVRLIYLYSDDDNDDDEDVDDDSNRKDGLDDVSLESTHTLTNETFNKNSQPTNRNNKQGRAECSNERLTDGPPSTSSSPSSASAFDGSGSGGITDGVADGACDGGISSALSSASISLPPTPLDTPVPVRKVQPRRKHGRNGNERKDGADGGKKGGGNKMAATSTTTATTKTTKRRRNRLGDVREEREQDTDSSATTGTSVGKRASRRAAQRQLSVSNATLTNVSLIIYL